MDIDMIGPQRAIRGKAPEPLELGDSARQFSDEISRGKSVQLIDMLVNLLLKGEDHTFKDLVQELVNKNADRPVGLEQFCATLDKYKPTACAFLRNWLDQPGHPIVKVKMLNEREFLLEQERHLSLDDADEEEKQEAAGQLWRVPILAVASNKRGQKEFAEVNLEERSALLKLPDSFEANSLKVNFDSYGFFCVMYPDALRRELQLAIKSGHLTTRDRLNLVDDAHHLFRSGHLKERQLLDMIGLYADIQESNGMVIARLADTFKYLKHFFALVPDEMKSIAKRLFGNYLRLTLKSSKESGLDHGVLLGQAAALGALIELGDKWAIDTALGMYRKSTGASKSIKCKLFACMSANREANRPSDIARHLRSPVYLAVSKHGSSDEYVQLVQMCKQADRMSELRIILMDSLAATEDPDKSLLIEELLTSD